MSWQGGLLKEGITQNPHPEMRLFSLRQTTQTDFSNRININWNYKMNGEKVDEKSYLSFICSIHEDLNLLKDLVFSFPCANASSEHTNFLVEEEWGKKQTGKLLFEIGTVGFITSP